MFNDRTEAGILLASRLRKFRKVAGVVLAIPRGGVPVAYEVAKELDLPLEIVLVKKLGHPLNKEYAIGAVGLNDVFLIPHEDVTESYINSRVQKLRSRLHDMQTKFMDGREPGNIAGRTVIVVDDGSATGNTLLATLRILRKQDPGKLVVAAPVFSKPAMQKLKEEADEVIAVLIPGSFHGVGTFYADFTQVSDDDVIEYLQELREPEKHV